MKPEMALRAAGARRWSGEKTFASQIVLWYGGSMECETLSDAAVAAAAGIPNSTLAAWLRRGHLERPAGGWRVEDAVALRVAWLLTSSGMPPDVALRLCDQNRHAVWRGCGWLVVSRRHSTDLFGGGAVSGEPVILDRREDLHQTLIRAAGSGADMSETVVIDLAAARRKSELALAHHLSTRRPRGRPRKNKEDDK